LAELYLRPPQGQFALQTVKEGAHSLIQRFEFNGQEYFAKQPRGRDSRPWERVLEKLRGSEVVRYAESMETLRELGFKGPEPVACLLRRRFGLLVESYIIYRAAEGRKAEQTDGRPLARALTALHDHGYMRRDAIPRNFLIDEEGDAVFIDFRLMRPRLLNSLRLTLEKDQLIRACASAADHVDDSFRQSLSFRSLYRYRRFARWIKKFRRRHKAWLYPVLLVLIVASLFQVLGQ